MVATLCLQSAPPLPLESRDASAAVAAFTEGVWTLSCVAFEQMGGSSASSPDPVGGHWLLLLMEGPGMPGCGWCWSEVSWPGAWCRSRHFSHRFQRMVRRRLSQALRCVCVAWWSAVPGSLPDVGLVSSCVRALVHRGAGVRSVRCWSSECVCRQGGVAVHPLAMRGGCSDGRAQHRTPKRGDCGTSYTQGLVRSGGPSGRLATCGRYRTHTSAQSAMRRACHCCTS